MSIEIKIPTVGESITSGLISTWHKKEGESVNAGDVLFTLGPGDRSDRITFVLDLPRASPEQDPWRRMVQAASSVARRVGGRLVDDAGRSLDAVALQAIEAQLAERQVALSEAGFPPGSMVARRLFN